MTDKNKSCDSYKYGIGVYCDHPKGSNECDSNYALWEPKEKSPIVEG